MEERDLHDPTLDAAWRAHVQDVPPRALDDSILAAAHRAVESGPRVAGAAPPRWKAWAPLAVAATLGAIALGVLQLAPREEDATRAVVNDAPVASIEQRAQPQRQAPAPPAPAPAASSPAPAASSSEPSAPAREPAAAPAERAAASSATAPTATSAPKPDVAQRRAQAPAPAAGEPFAETPTDKLAKQSSETVKEEALRREMKQDRIAPEPTQKQRIAQAPAFEARKDAPGPQPFPAAPPPPPVSASSSLPAPAAAPAPATTPQSAPAPTPRVGGLTAAAPAGVAGALDAQNAAPAAQRERDTSAARGRDASDVRAKVATTRTPDDFIREIHRLRAEGRDADAALALAAFRAAYADADERLPDDLRAWARGVARP